MTERWIERLAQSLRSEDRGERLVDGLRLCVDYENAIRRQRERKLRELPEGTDPHDLSKTGWGVIFAPEEKGRAAYYLSRLLEYREEQAGRLFQEEIYSPMRGGGRAFLWLKKNEAPGTIDPEALPYYLLLVGNPEQIPFDFQYELGVNRAVGRIFFEDPRDYGRYAEAVIQAEENGVDRPKKVDLFSVQGEDDTATDVMARFLVEPLARQLPERVPDWPVEVWRRPRDRKDDLAGRLRGGSDTPGLLLVACHGKRLPFGDPRQEALQGALVCQDGFVHAGDLPALAPEERPLHGLVAGLFACHSAGTPVEDNFPEKGLALDNPEEPAVIAETEFLARLPRALLARGALGVLGHVDRGWTASFRWLYKDKQTAAARSLEDSIVRLLRGHRLGHALRPLQRRYSNIAAHLLPLTEALINRRPLEPVEVTQQWIAFLDARNYVVLGDPAIYALGRRLGEPSWATSARSSGGEPESDDPPDPDYAPPVYLQPGVARRARAEAQSRRLDLNAWVHEVLEAHLQPSPQPTEETPRATVVKASEARRYSVVEPVSVALDAAPDEPCRAEMIERLGGVGLLRLVEAPQAADLRLHLLGPRGVPGWRAPAAVLGKLDEPGWAVTAGDGELVGPFRPLSAGDATEVAFETVLCRAQQRLVAELARRTGGPAVDLILERRVEGQLQSAEASWAGGEVTYSEGEELALEIRNECGHQLWAYPFDLGVGGGVEWIRAGSGAPIAPCRSAFVDDLRLVLPEEFPFEVPGQRPAAGRETLVLLASTEPVDLDPLFGGGGAPDTRAALGRILAAIVSQLTPPTEADLRDPGWSAVARSFLLRAERG